MTFKRKGDEETVPGRGTVCTKALRKALSRKRYLWRSPVGWSPKCERSEGMEAGELRSQAGAREGVWALLWGQFGAILKVWSNMLTQSDFFLTDQ